MATVSDAFKSARSLLNDDAAISWSDAVLLPKLQEAHRELLLELELNHIPVIRAVSSIIIVPAGSTDLGDNQPADMAEPTDMYERDVGSSLDDFVEMVELADVPNVSPVESLLYWVWEGERIKFVGATEDREVRIRYRKKITTPTINTDDLGFLFAELYIGPRVAALASGNDKFTMQARDNLDKIIQMNVVGQQSMPVRRLPYRKGHLLQRIRAR
jgi:hypothetical protein